MNQIWCLCSVDWSSDILDRTYTYKQPTPDNLLWLHVYVILFCII